MFEQESKVLEDLVYRLGMYSHYLTRKYKENIYHRQVELCLLADLVIDIYTVVALLGR